MVNPSKSIDTTVFTSKSLDKVTYYDYNTDKEVLIAYRLYNGNATVHNTFRISKGDIKEVIKVLEQVEQQEVQDDSSLW